jgi:putative DNA primase/helicase
VTAAEIAAMLGKARRSGKWWRCPCPVHASRGATLAVRDGESNLIVKCWAGCDPRDVLAELRRRGLINDDGRGNDNARPTPAPTWHNDNGRRIAAAQRIWNAARDGRGSPVADYFTGRRITIAPPPSLRYAPCLRRPDGIYGPAMVARVDDVDGQLIGVHRTWLDPARQWYRRGRASLGPIGGGAVRLAPPAETLLIGEGIETTAAGMLATAQPAWAALSTSGMVALVLPPIVRSVVILADHDVNGAGERAARTAAARWLAEGRRVRLAMPPEPATDFNDVLLGRDHTRIEVLHVAA